MAISKPKILVVDDHPDSRVILALAMEKWGYEVVEARNGKEAIAKIRTGDFDLVVLDIALPFNGWEVARTMKSNPRKKHIPILAVTALDTAECRKMCVDAGFNDFLPKPFSIDDLKAKVEALLRKRSRQSGSRRNHSR